MLIQSVNEKQELLAEKTTESKRHSQTRRIAPCKM